ncbi:hypothetical protein [Desulfosporosinus sp. SB140]
MPIPSDDGKFIHCSYCNQKFRFGYDADKHEKENHADQLSN